MTNSNNSWIDGFKSKYIILLFVCFLQCHNPTGNVNLNTQHNVLIEKQRGAHVFGRLDSLNVQPLLKSNYDWITMVSFAGQNDYDSADLHYFGKDSLSHTTERNKSWLNQMEIAHAAGFKIFVKPHIWINEPSDNKWRSDIFPTNDQNWHKWKEHYRSFILSYAKLAEAGKAEMFCVGTELSRLTNEKPIFWKTLIEEVRSVYSGKITYAANWHNEYENISFWQDLDYIGIQAYFPLVKNENPTVKQISKGWEKYIRNLERLSVSYDRAIVFTEMGYKSTADSAIEPWLWIDYETDQDPSISLETQANCYQAFFDTIWRQTWFAGVHIWQLRSDHRTGRGKNALDFTPQGKPAADVIAKGFAQTSQ